MKIVFDGRWIGRTGIGRYSSELLQHLQQLDHSNQYWVLLLPQQYDKLELTNPNFHKALTKHEVYTWQEQLLLPWQIKRLGADLVHFPHFAMPILYPGQFVVTIHDLTLIDFKNVRGSGVKRWLYEAKQLAMRLVLRAAIYRSQAIITPTEWVKNDLTKRYHIDPPKISVTLEAVNPMQAAAGPIDHLGVGNSFLLYVGNYYPYKNIGRLLEAYTASVCRQQGTKLVLAGPPDFFQEQAKRLAKDTGLSSDEVIFTGFVTEAELAGLYRQATLYVFPSLSEGFGLPGLEAMAQGTPVLAANASCLPEVYNGAAVYFDPYNAADLTTKIDELCQNPQKLSQLSAAGLAQVAHFSWSRMARITLAVYKDALR